MTFERPVLPGPALAAAMRASTLKALRGPDAYDAVIVGAGAAGGLAASSLTEAGLRVLVLEAGSARRRTASLARTRLAPADVSRQPFQSRCYAWEFAPDAYVDDIDCPYTTPPEHPFVWIRSRQLGGRLAVPGHGRQYYRFAPEDFAPADGLSPVWPLRPGELDFWYASVEHRLGLTGRYDGLRWLPDSELSAVLEPTQDEAAVQRAITARWPGARPVLARFAPPFDHLEAAALTGRLLIRTGAIAREVEIDDCGQVKGVVWIDHRTRAEHRARASLVFLCASALESTRLLLLSRSGRTPQGLGARSGALGRYLMDHVWVRAIGEGSPLSREATFKEGRCIYLPRFDARDSREPSPGRGFGVQLYMLPGTEGRSYFSATAFGEMLPRAENFVALDSGKVDAWGVPVLRIDCVHGDVERMRAREQVRALREIAEVLGVRLTSLDEEPQPPGTSVHESGTARMGADPVSSVLDPYNQCWDAKGLYVTDAACFPSQGAQNPTLTIFALTARACDHALGSRRGARTGG